MEKKARLPKIEVGIDIFLLMTQIRRITNNGLNDAKVVALIATAGATVSTNDNKVGVQASVSALADNRKFEQTKIFL